jgi:hypothetical protein
VHAAVVDGLHPCGEQCVQLHQVGQFAARADLDEELLTHGAEEPFDLAAAGELARTGVDQPDAETCAGAQQLLVDHGGTVVQIDRLRDPAGGEPITQRGLQADGVLASGPPIAGQQPAVVVDEREQDRLAAVDRRAVQRVTGPPHVRCVGLEPAERARRLPVRASVEFQAHKVPL